MNDKVWKQTPRLQKEAMRDYSDLSPQLIGKEGLMVEVADRKGSKPRRFFVGRSDGPKPVHVEMQQRNDKEGEKARKQYWSVRRISKALTPAPKKIQITFFDPNRITYQNNTGRRRSVGEPEVLNENKDIQTKNV